MFILPSATNPFDHVMRPCYTQRTDTKNQVVGGSLWYRFQTNTKMFFEDIFFSFFLLYLALETSLSLRELWNDLFDWGRLTDCAFFPLRFGSVLTFQFFLEQNDTVPVFASEDVQTSPCVCCKTKVRCQMKLQMYCHHCHLSTVTSWKTAYTVGF